MLKEQITLREEAQDCRRKALAYIGQPEATFLMGAAKAFDDLADAEEGSRLPPEIANNSSRGLVVV